METALHSTDAGSHRRLLSYVFSAVLVVVATLVATMLQRVFELQNPPLIFLTGVLFSAATGGLRPSLLCAVLSLLSYDFFFVEPLHTLAVNDPQDVISLVAFLIVAVLTSHLTARINEQRLAAEEREAHTSAIYEFGREVADAVGLDQVLEVITRRIARLFDTRVVVLLPEAGLLKVRASYPPGIHLPEDEIGAAQWAWTHGSTAAAATDDAGDGGWLSFSLATGRGETAVLALDRRSTGLSLSVARSRLLEAIVRQAAVSVERCNIDPVFDEKAIVDQIIEASENGIVVLDASGVVVHVNTVACLILAMDRMLVIGRSLEDVARREPREPQVERLIEAVRGFLATLEAPADKLELGVFLRGRDHYYVLQLAPFRARTEARPGAILSFQDVTYMRDQEARREALMATLSHELRTPLTSLRMAVERMRRLAGNGTSPAGEILETAHEDVLRLQEVAQHFLDLARTRSVVARIEPRPLDVNSLIQRSVRLVSLQAREKDLVVDAPPAETPMISGDEIKLTWALSNLLTNAIRYTPEGGTVRITAAPTADSVAISVEDTGPGIPLEEQERVFERFAQSAASGEIGAAGLGLAIVRDIVQMHGGRIRLRSEPGRGTCFTMDLPRD